MDARRIAELIEAGLPGARATVNGADGVHFEAVVVAPQFAGEKLRERHRLVYATLGACLGQEIHALSLQVYAPAEWAARGPH